MHISFRRWRSCEWYFHDNSAKTLEELAAFYTDMFATNAFTPVQLTPQDEADMVAYLKLLKEARRNAASSHRWHVWHERRPFK